MNTLAAPKFNLQHLLIGVFMLLSAGLAFVLTPKAKLADQGPRIDLETMIPKQFGEWRVDESLVPIQVSPDVQAALNKVYNQTLARTYINSQGQRVMLSIAYGADQSDSVQVHLPEGCYTGQGFAVGEKRKDQILTPFGDLPVARLLAQQGPRNEPITYWVMVGNEIARDTWEMKKIKLRYTLKGEIAEGMLVRISNITPDTSSGYALHEQFVKELLSALPPDRRVRLIGRA